MDSVSNSQRAGRRALPPGSATPAHFPDQSSGAREVRIMPNRWASGSPFSTASSWRTLWGARRRREISASGRPERELCGRPSKVRQEPAATARPPEQGNDVDRYDSSFRPSRIWPEPSPTPTRALADAGASGRAGRGLSPLRRAHRGRRPEPDALSHRRALGSAGHPACPPLRRATHRDPGTARRHAPADEERRHPPSSLACEGSAGMMRALSP